MKVKKLIAELQKFNPELEVFMDEIMELQHINHVKKIKVFKDKKQIFMMGNGDSFSNKLRSARFVSFDRNNKAAMNTKNPQAVIISWMGDYKKKKSKS